MSKQLTPGSLARIYRNGTELIENVLVPVEGPLTVRSLAPGAYVARDDNGGDVDFEVRALDEETTVWRPRGSSDIVGTVEPGKSVVVPQTQAKDTEPYSSLRTPSFPNVGPDGPREAPELESDNPGVGPAPARRRAPREEVGPGVLVDGGPGSALVLDDVPMSNEDLGNPVLDPRAGVIPAEDEDAVSLKDGDGLEAVPEDRPEEPAVEQEIVVGRPVGPEPARQNPPAEGGEETA